MQKCLFCGLQGLQRGEHRIVVFWIGTLKWPCFIFNIVILPVFFYSCEGERSPLNIPAYLSLNRHYNVSAVFCAPQCMPSPPHLHACQTGCTMGNRVPLAQLPLMKPGNLSFWSTSGHAERDARYGSPQVNDGKL